MLTDTTTKLRPLREARHAEAHAETVAELTAGEAPAADHPGGAAHHEEADLNTKSTGASGCG